MYIQDFQKIKKILSNIKGIPNIVEDFNILKKTSRDFMWFNDLKGFKGIEKDFRVSIDLNKF